MYNRAVTYMKNIHPTCTVFLKKEVENIIEVASTPDWKYVSNSEYPLTSDIVCVEIQETNTPIFCRYNDNKFICIETKKEISALRWFHISFNIFNGFLK
jgi:hypothetical protein